jgi:predicted ABC-type ATPase
MASIAAAERVGSERAAEVVLTTVEVDEVRRVVEIRAPSPELALARVAERVAQGGHDVPSEVVRRRFVAGLRNFFSLCEHRVDSWQVFDNSLPAGLRLIAARPAGEKRRVLDAGAWSSLVEQGR